MTDYRRDIARITDTMLGWEDHGVFTCVLTVTYGDGGMQGVGMYSLDTPTHNEDGTFAGRVGTSTGMQFVMRLMRACGVARWEDLEGRTVFVLQDLGETEPTWGTNRVVGVENLPTEPGERFVFADVLEKWVDA